MAQDDRRRLRPTVSSMHGSATQIPVWPGIRQGMQGILQALPCILQVSGILLQVNGVRMRGSLGGLHGMGLLMRRTASELPVTRMRMQGNSDRLQ
jgi:hypothetical protein